MPNFNGRGSPSFAQGPKGLADMLASALRGGVKATLGMPGDIERMGRMGINALGGSVDPQSALPSTEDWDKRLPPVNPMTGQNFDQVEKMGEFLPLNAGGPIMRAAGKANSAVQALRQSAPAVTNMGRRTALKGIGAAGAGAAVAPELVVQALRNIPATPVAGKVAAPVVAEAAAKAAARVGLTNSVLAKVGSAYWGGDAAKLVPATFDGIANSARKLHPEITDDQIHDAILNLSGDYGVKLDSAGKIVDSPPLGSAGPEGVLDWDALVKMGVQDQESLAKSLFLGKIRAEDLSPEVLESFHMPGSVDANTHPWMRLIDSIQGNYND